MKMTKARIYGFNGMGTEAVGYVELPVELGIRDRRRVRMLLFIVMDIESPYNAILGRPALADFRAALAPWCLTLKFPTDNGVGVVHGDQSTDRVCYVAELRDINRKEKGKGVEKPVRIQEPKD